jgi:hypothetical protein
MPKKKPTILIPEDLPEDPSKFQESSVPPGEGGRKDKPTDVSTVFQRVFLGGCLTHSFDGLREMQRVMERDPSWVLSGRKIRVVCISGLDHECPGSKLRSELEIQQMTVRMDDDPSMETEDLLKQMEPCAEFLCEGWKEGAGLYIHCHAGKSRSVFLLSLFLNRYYGLTFLEALTRIARVRDIDCKFGFHVHNNPHLFHPGSELMSIPLLTP